MAGARLRNADYRGALESAQSALDAANRIAEKRPGAGAAANIARGRMQLANILWITGDLRGAMSHYESAVRDFETLVRQRPDHAATILDLQEAYRRTGDLLGNHAYFHFDQPDKALEYHRKSLALAGQMVARDPADAQALSALAVALRRVGAVLRESSPAESAAYYQRALGITADLMKGSPGDRTYLRDRANTRLGLAIAWRGMGKTKDALRELEDVVAAQRRMLDEHPERSVVREDMFDALVALGELRLELWEGPALEVFREALATARELTGKSPDSLYAQRCLALASRGMGDYYARLARRGPAAAREDSLTEAGVWYRKALAIWSEWRGRGVGLPYSANREREILKLLQAQPVYSSRAASLAK
jgi:tetratricopeptide (TPR) repeat protein